MTTPASDRFEIVLLSDQPDAIHLWAQVPAAQAKRLEYNKEMSVKILGGGAALLLILLIFFRAPTLLIALGALIVLFPLKLVGMVGFSRGA